MSGLTHLDASGAAHMVDVSAKPVTHRRAVASGRIRMNAAALAAVRDGDVPKGDVIAAARIAGIMAAKQTATLIPLCHPLPISSAAIDFAFTDDGITATADIMTSAQTGVEMEAITAVSIALLTIYDMVKALDKGCIVESLRLLVKEGGKSGRWTAA